MSFNFKARLETGQVAAAHVEASRKEIGKVLNQLKLDLSDFLDVKLELVIKDEFEFKKDKGDSNPVATFGTLRTHIGIPVKTGYKTIAFKGALDNRMELFQIKEGKNVYPLNIKSDVNKFIVVSAEDLVEVIGSILEDPKTHAKFRAFKKHENGNEQF
ncbi:hypothetical protein J4H23_04475 [Vibrio alginolyticus]|uniref:hypothetical protein n=1 Tax=Vibrio alginolyticus TaxID=663 RepID=UPI001BD33794|nr:hypothetical protein [Vibrio alginolyticus]MBS9927342.1 hypothetical protein [Vibrio alginolyticus]